MDDRMQAGSQSPIVVAEESKAHRVLKVRPALQVRKAFPGLPVPKEMPELTVHQVFRVRPDLQAKKAILARRARLARKGT
jgi:hypothetical protein